MIVCFYWSLICVYRVTKVTKSFWKILLKLCSLEMYVVVETHQDPRIELYHNTREVTGGNIRARGVIPHQITLRSPLSRMAGVDQITKRLSCFDQWLVLQIHLMNPNPSTNDDMGWGLPSRGHYAKVMTRSEEGQICST